MDQQPAQPSDVVFAVGDFACTRSFHFRAMLNNAGVHEVEMMFLVDGGGTAFFGDRTLWVATAPEVVTAVAAPSGPSVETSGSEFSDIPNLTSSLYVPSSGDLAVTVCGEVFTSASARMFVRAEIDGQSAIPATPSFLRVISTVSGHSHSCFTTWSLARMKSRRNGRWIRGEQPIWATGP